MHLVAAAVTLVIPTPLEEQRSLTLGQVVVQTPPDGTQWRTAVAVAVAALVAVPVGLHRQAAMGVPVLSLSGTPAHR